MKVLVFLLLAFPGMVFSQNLQKAAFAAGCFWCTEEAFEKVPGVISAVSSGIFAVPLDICARAYLKAVRACALSKVRLCLRDQPVIDAVLREMGQ